jgi:hypothetical protein
MGKTHPQTKISDEDVLKIREMWNDGVPIKYIAPLFPISRGYLSSIVQGNDRVFV